MKALLHTHALLWWVTDDPKLSDAARDAILTADVAVSVASLWEIEIKRGLGRIHIDTRQVVHEVSQTEGFRMLEIRPTHLLTHSELPLLLAIRRVGDAPVYLSPPDLLRRLNSLGWIPEEQHASLPPEALEPPTEADAISLDRVLARFQPSGLGAQLTRGEPLKEHAGEIVAAIKAHVAEQTARHGALEQDQPLG